MCWDLDDYFFLYVPLYAYKSEMNTSENRYVCGTYIHAQWNLSNPDTLGTEKSFLIREVSLFQGY